MQLAIAMAAPTALQLLGTATATATATSIANWPGLAKSLRCWPNCQRATICTIKQTMQLPPYMARSRAELAI